MKYRFVSDPNLNINFEDDILYTPLRQTIDVDANNLVKNNRLNKKPIATTKQTNEQKRGISLFSWFMIIAILAVLLWYVYGGKHSHASPIEINPKNMDLQLQSPDFGTHMKYGIF